MKRRQFIKGSAIIGESIATSNLAFARSGLLPTLGSRKVHRILNADKTKVGTLPILRAFAGNHLDYVSPYVLFDEFGPVTLQAGSDLLRVDAHPHAGFSPTTYFLEGSGHHKDSLNFDFQVNKGEFMVFDSGRGAIHMEETGQRLYDQGGSYHGFQIWLNSPAEYKWVDPSTHVHKDQKFGSKSNDQYDIKVILGNYNGTKSSVETYSPAFYYHLQMKENGRIEIPTEATNNAFLYIIDGEIEVEGRRVVKANQLVLYQRGASIVDIYSECGADLLVLGGQPLNEPVYSYGPFVMNTEDEINQCIRNYRAGRMGNPDVVNR